VIANGKQSLIVKSGKSSR